MMNNLSKMSKKDIENKLKEKAYKRLKLNLNLNSPKTLAEKITWLMINDDDKFVLKSKCADKILLHEYCKEKLGEDICVPILKIYDSPQDVDFGELPSKFVLKCNHGYAMNIIVDKENQQYTTLKNLYIESQRDCQKQLQKWLNTNFGDDNYQWHYALINPKCYAEKFLDDGHQTLTDYKVMCFNGEPKMIQVISDRYTSDLHANIYDTDWNWFDLGWNDFPQDKDHLDEKPKELNKIIEYSKILSSDFDFVRVDFYIINDKLYLGELTFSPDGGIFKYKNPETDLYWGHQLKLPIDSCNSGEGVSICISAYKAESFIKETLDSIYQQTWIKNHNNWEVIVGIDGCQETLNMLEKIMPDYDEHLRILMMDSNKGTYVTSNTIMNQAKYDNLIRFDSDDIMKVNCVETLMNYTDYDVVTFRMQNFGIKNTVGNSIGVLMIKKEIIDKYGGYQPWSCSADSELLRRLKNITKHKSLDDILFLRRTHKDSLTRKKGPTQLAGGRGIDRQKYLAYVDNLHVYNEKDAIIERVVNSYREIFPTSEYTAAAYNKTGTSLLAVDTLYLPNLEVDKKVIYTVAIGNKPAELSYKDPDYDYICFTDKDIESETWQIRPIPEDLTKLEDKRKKAILKICPHEYLKEYDLSIYVENGKMVGDLSKFELSTKSSVYMYSRKIHCIYKEAINCIINYSDDGNTIRSQMCRYQSEKYPKYYGLVNTTFIIRLHNTPYCVELMNKWKSEVMKGSYMDQLSFNYCLWKIGGEGFSYIK